MQSNCSSEWWPIHLKASRGQELSEQERQIHREGLDELQKHEILSMDREAILATRGRIADLSREQRELATRRDRIDAEIAALEAALSDQAKRLLGVEG